MTLRASWTVPVVLTASSLALFLAACSKGDEQGGNPCSGAGAGAGPGSGAPAGKGGAVTGGGGVGTAGGAGGVVGTGGVVATGGSGGSVTPEQPDFLAERGIAMPFASYEAE